MSKKPLTISEEAKVQMPMKTVASLIALVAIGTWAYFGINEKLNLVEMVEIKKHPWFVGVQFHPELKSTLANVHPLFKDFISAAIKYRDGK